MDYAASPIRHTDISVEVVRVDVRSALSVKKENSHVNRRPARIVEEQSETYKIARPEHHSVSRILRPHGTACENRAYVDFTQEV